MNAQKIGVAGLALLLGTAACNLQRESSAYSTGPVTTRTVRVLRREFREGDAFTRAGKVRKFNWRGDAYPDDYNVTLAVDDRTNYVLDDRWLYERVAEQGEACYTFREFRRPWTDESGKAQYNVIGYDTISLLPGACDAQTSRSQ